MKSLEVEKEGCRGPEGQAQRPEGSLQGKALQKVSEDKEILVGQQQSVTDFSANTAAGTRHQPRDSPSTETRSGDFFSLCRNTQQGQLKSGSRHGDVCFLSDIPDSKWANL